MLGFFVPGLLSCLQLFCFSLPRQEQGGSLRQWPCCASKGNKRGRILSLYHFECPCWLRNVAEVQPVLGWRVAADQCITVEHTKVSPPCACNKHCLNDVLSSKCSMGWIINRIIKRGVSIMGLSEPPFMHSTVLCWCSTSEWAYPWTQLVHPILPVAAWQDCANEYHIAKICVHFLWRCMLVQHVPQIDQALSTDPVTSDWLIGSVLVNRGGPKEVCEPRSAPHSISKKQWNVPKFWINLYYSGLILGIQQLSSIWDWMQ